MSRRKIATTVYMNERDMDRLKTLSARTKVPMAEFIREALARYLDGVDRKEREAAAGRAQ